MTPAARAAAAIEILDRILTGASAEQTLTNWARASRFAGSGDRHAIRDLVFDAIRCRRSFAALGGSDTGRGLILGGFRAQGIELDTMFTGEGHAPVPVSDQEAASFAHPEGLAALDCPDWLAPSLQASLGDKFVPVMRALQHRAPVFLRVNKARSSLAEVMAGLASESIAVQPHPLAKTALEVTDNARKIQNSTCYKTGLAELQDVASQAVVEALPLSDGMRVLDYCAGGGGKTLAMAAQAKVQLFAHDADPRRMRDLPERAKRAGAKVQTLTKAEVFDRAPYDLVLIDVPCSGSGSWRRAPEAKWALTADRLKELTAIQAQILEQTAKFVLPGGWLAYVTCSLLSVENQAQVDGFLTEFPTFRLHKAAQFTPLDGGDGFFFALMGRNV